MKKLQLILTNPCNQNWEEMQPAGEQRYCDSCSKHVVDLSSRTDLELIQFFERKKDNVCGRLLNSQLNRELVLPVQKLNWRWLLPLAVGASFISPANAQGLKPIAVQHIPAAQPTPVVVGKLVANASNTYLIKGKVINHQTGAPLKGVKIKQVGYANVLAQTDSAGRFELSVAEGKLATKFVFELNGYARVEDYVNDGMVMKMEVSRSIVLGGLSTISLTKEPLYLISSGKKSCTVDRMKFTEIQPDWIEKIDILKDASATAIYGAKAANGVVLVEIKKQYAKFMDFSKK